MSAYDILTDTLTAVEAAFTTAAITLPDRRHIHFGLPSIDCEAVIISFERIYTGMPDLETPAIEPCGYPRSMEFSAWILRCISTVQSAGGRASFPSPATMSNEAQTATLDAETLVFGLQQAYLAETWLERCTALVFGPLVTVEPEGAFSGVRLNMTVQLTG